MPRGAKQKASPKNGQVAQVQTSASSKPPPRKRQRVHHNKNVTPNSVTTPATENHTPSVQLTGGPNVDSGLVQNIVDQIMSKTTEMVATAVAQAMDKYRADNITSTGPAFSSTVQPTNAGPNRDHDNSTSAGHTAADDHEPSTLDSGSSDNIQTISNQTQDLPDVTSAILGQGNSGHLITHDLPLGFNVSEKRRNRIFNNEFVEFSSLLFPVGENDTHFNITMKGNGGLGLTAQTKSKRLFNIGQWNQAFDIFVAIHVTKYPDDVQGLLKYGNTVRLINDTYGFQAANYYDENFRKLRIMQPLPWVTTHNELWRLASLKSSTNSFQNKAQNFRGKYFHQSSQSGKISSRNHPFRRNDNRNTGPKGFCWSYEREGKCQQPAGSCKYKHECHVCGKKHPAKNCPSASVQSANTSGSTKA